MKLSVMYEADIGKAVADVSALIHTKRYKPGYAIQIVASKYGIDKSELARALGTRHRLIIEWVKPNLAKEVGEYFENEATKPFLAKHGYVFRNEEELLKVMAGGSAQEIDKAILKKQGQNLTLTERDFQNELQDPEYAASYLDMREKLLKDKKITLPMPILIKIGSIYWGYAGNRRMNLAWNHNIPVKFYVVELSDKELIQTSLF